MLLIKSRTEKHTTKTLTRKEKDKPRDGGACL